MNLSNEREVIDMITDVNAYVDNLMLFNKTYTQRKKMIIDDFNNDNMDIVTCIECIERLMSLSLNGIMYNL